MAAIECSMDSNRRPGGYVVRFLVLVAAIGAMGLGVGGCGSFRFRSPIVSTKEEEKKSGPEQMSAAGIQSELMSYTDTLNGAISQVWNSVGAEGRAESGPEGLVGSNDEHASQVRRAALANKLSTVSASLSIASSPNPRVALADMITMVTLERMVLEGPAAAKLYGEKSAADLVAAYRGEEDDAWRIAAKAMTPDQQQELKDLITEWRAEHPDATYVCDVRLEDFAARRQQTFVKTQSSGSILSLLALDPLAGLDPAEKEVQKSRMLAERMFFYASRSPQLVKWQVESLYQDFMRTPEAKKAVASMEGATESAARVSKMAEDLPKNVAAERSAALDQLFVKLAEERKAAEVDLEKLLNDQRAATLKDLDTANVTIQAGLKEYRAAAEATQKAAVDLGVTVKAADVLVGRFASDPNEPKKDTIDEFRVAAAQAGDAADRLTVLAKNIDTLVSPGAESERASKLKGAAADLQAASAAVIDHAFGRLLILVIVAPFAVVLAMGVYRWTGRGSRGV